MGVASLILVVFNLLFFLSKPPNRQIKNPIKFSRYTVDGTAYVDIFTVDIFSGISLVISHREIHEKVV